MRLSRRDFLAGSLMAGPILRDDLLAKSQEERLRKAFADLERKHGGRLGVAILDTAAKKPFACRGNERFPMCSTHKILSAAGVLARVDAGRESLDRRVTFAKESLVPYSPVTEKHVGEAGMTVRELCEAAVTVSDNTAANLLFEMVGGPQALTAFLRGLGIGVIRLDRLEPDLNEAKPGDPRDTTSPLAMVEALRKLLLGTVLAAPSRDRLAGWMVACETGRERLRAGAPKDWRVGDKTGSGGRNATNDVAILWPPDGAPILVAAYFAGSEAGLAERNAVLAEVGRVATARS